MQYAFEYSNSPRTARTRRRDRLNTALPWLLALLLAALTGTAGAQTELLLTDQNGQPLPGAVVWAGDAITHPGNADGGAINVDQLDKRFVPFVSITRPGAEVYFPNSDDIRHHVYSFSRGNNFERKLYRADEADPVTFQTEGVVALGCNIHDNMQAYVIVSDEQAAVSDADGRVALASVPDSLRIWHPLLLEDELRIDQSELAARPAGGYTLALPVTWEDPQAPRSNSDLESLLKKFSKDAS